jgi:putative transposase
MPPFASPNSYKHHRFPAEIISHDVWLYYRFCLSYRDVEALLFARGIMVTYEAIRKSCRKFGQAYANQLRRRRPQRGDKWHLDEVFLTIRGERHDLWRAVDQDGHVLDILVQRRRDKTAAKKFSRKHPQRMPVCSMGHHHGSAEKLWSRQASARAGRGTVAAPLSQESRRERPSADASARTTDAGVQVAQRFLTAYGPIAQHFRPRRHHLRAPEYRQELGKRFHTWQEITSLPTAA